MKATQQLHDLGQSLWLDNITRDLLTSGTLQRYIDELSVTGLTSNPTILHQAISGSATYDSGIRRKLAGGKSGEALLFELALEDIRQAADLFRRVITEPAAWTDSSRWKSRRCSPTNRAADQGGPEARRGLGGVAVHQPLGRRGGSGRSTPALVPSGC